MTTKDYHGITIDLSRDSLLSPQADDLLRKFYMKKGETSPQEAFARPAVAFCAGDLELAQRIYDYASKQWMMYSSPVLSNAPNQGETTDALPISCFLTFVDDNLTSLIEHPHEVAWLEVRGGGVAGHWSDVRAISDKAPGPMPFIGIIDRGMKAWKQGKTRKGSYAAYLDISHPEIINFMEMRKLLGGDEDLKFKNLHHAVNIPDAFMAAVYANTNWDLIDPDTGDVHSTCRARELWERLLETRARTGEPYLNFIDTANRALPLAQQELGLKIHGSNLCNEIHLATSEDRTAVCCLSSLNVEYFEEWKDTTIVEDMVTFLDNVITYFIKHAPPEMSKARYSAMRERALGLGVYGWHSLLQSKSLPFESPMAIGLNNRVFDHIKDHAAYQSVILGATRGEAPDMVGTGRRNSHLLAIAPTANLSIIGGASPSIEPWKSNAFTHGTRAGLHLVKNKYLQRELQSHGMDTPDIWQSIITNGGSVQHLEALPEWSKEVFKTFFELDQHAVVDHAAMRQPYICQGQSVNLAFPPKSDRAYVNSVHLSAWKKGLKGLYYFRSDADKKAEVVSRKVERVALIDADECTACQ